MAVHKNNLLAIMLDTTKDLVTARLASRCKPRNVVARPLATADALPAVMHCWHQQSQMDSVKCMASGVNWMRCTKARCICCSAQALAGNVIYLQSFQTIDQERRTLGAIRGTRRFSTNSCCKPFMPVRVDTSRAMQQGQACSTCQSGSTAVTSISTNARSSTKALDHHDASHGGESDLTHHVAIDRRQCRAIASHIGVTVGDVPGHAHHVFRTRVGQRAAQPTHCAALAPFAAHEIIGLKVLLEAFQPIWPPTNICVPRAAMPLA